MTGGGNESRAKEVFLDALELEGAERDGFLKDACGDNDSLRARVEALILAADGADDWLGDTTPGAGAGRAAVEDLEPGARIDDYVLTEKIGEGGFGSVYLAMQEHPVRRKVALKVVKLGMDTRAVIGRFELERQALAVMEHLHIAKVLDAGSTDTGRPYFVMEFVDGEPITQYCEERELGLRERLRLFATVCHAIQHAHQKGVIHRDIKPTNVLVGSVDGRAVPKVIDFGIAKATERPLQEGTLFTEDGHLVGTPSYMSPEQADLAGFVDTRSDVYSLGALLYELCCGRPPFELTDLPFPELLETICHTEPVRPSARIRLDGARTTTITRIEREVDWIVMRCLEKDPARRYPTAVALAQEIERHLDGLPVEAAPPSTWYRVRKLARRHRAAVLAGAGMTAALTVGLVGTLAGMSRAKVEAARARDAEQRASDQAREAVRQSEVARAVNEFLNEDLLGAVAPSDDPARGRDVLMRDVLDAAAVRIEHASAGGGRFSEAPLVEAAIRHMVGETYLSLSLSEKAAVHLARAVDLRSAELDEGDPRTLLSLQRLGNAYRRLDDTEGAREVLVRLEGVLGGELEVRALDDLNVLHLKGMVHLADGELAEAEVLLERASGLAQGLLGYEHVATLGIDDTRAVLYSTIGRSEEARELFQQNYAILSRTRGLDDIETMTAGVNLANNLRGTGRTDEAIALYERHFEGVQQVFGEEHTHALTAAQGYARALMDKGRYKEAEPLFVITRERALRTLGAMHTEALEVVAGLGRLYELTGRFELAEAEYTHAYEASAESLGPEHLFTLGRLSELCSVLYSQGRIEEAERRLLELWEAKQRRLGEYHSETLITQCNYAIACMDLGREREAERLQRDAVEKMAVQFGRKHQRTVIARSDLAAMLARFGDFDEAREHAEESLQVAREIFPADSHQVATCLIRLSSAVAGQEDWEEAVEYLLEAEEILKGYEGSFRRGEVAEYLSAIYAELGLEEESAFWEAERRVRDGL